jgi:hypothetical protein
VPFYISAVLCAIAALCSLLILKPLVASRIAKETRSAEGRALSEALAQASAVTTHEEKHLAGTSR